MNDIYENFKLNNLSLLHPDSLPLPEPPQKITRETKYNNNLLDSAFDTRDICDIQSPTPTSILDLKRSISSDFCEDGCEYISSPEDTNSLEYSNDNLKNLEMDIGNGYMPYIKEEWTRNMCENAWHAINLTKNWDFVSQPINSFILSDDKRINIISDKMTELGYDGHTRSSFGCTMRNMQYLAQNGLEKFKLLFKDEEEYNPVLKSVIKEIKNNLNKNTLERGTTGSFGNMSFTYMGGF